MKCCQCFENISTSDKVTQCNGCQLKIHIKCLDLSDAEKKFIEVVRSNNIKIFCNRCNITLSAVTEVKNLVNELKETFDKRLQQIETVMSTLISSNRSYQNNTENIISESVDRSLRACNLVFYNVPEANPNSSDFSNDVTTINDILELCDPKLVVCPESVSRIGKFDTQKNRPVKVIMKNLNDKMVCLRNKNKLLREKKFNKVIVTDDKTPKQLSHLKALREELKDRVDKGEKDLTIKYIQNIPQIINRKN